MIEKISDNIATFGVVILIAGFFYNRSKQQEMEMKLRMKELEIQAMNNKNTRGDNDDASAGPAGETKKKK